MSAPMNFTKEDIHDIRQLMTELNESNFLE